MGGELKEALLVAQPPAERRPGLLLAWHVVSRKRSLVLVRTLSTGNRRTVASSRIGWLIDPSVFRSQVSWVDSRFGVSSLKLTSLGSGKRRVLVRIRGRKACYWSTSLASGTVYMTRWTVASGAAAVYKTST